MTEMETTQDIYACTITVPPMKIGCNAEKTLMARRQEMNRDVWWTSADSTMVTIRLPYNDENKDNIGSLRVYEFKVIDGRWVQRGVNLDGESQDAETGFDVSISVDRAVFGSNVKILNN